MPKRLSDNCADILKRMITVDPDKRITAAQALEHEWIVHKGGKHKDADHEKQ